MRYSQLQVVIGTQQCQEISTTYLLRPAIGSRLHPTVGSRPNNPDFRTLSGLDDATLHRTNPSSCTALLWLILVAVADRISVRGIEVRRVFGKQNLLER